MRKHRTIIISAPLKPALNYRRLIYHCLIKM